MILVIDCVITDEVTGCVMWSGELADMTRAKGRIALEAIMAGGGEVAATCGGLSWVVRGVWWQWSLAR